MVYSINIPITNVLIKIERSNYALEKGENSLEEEGYHADAKYAREREELISKIDSDLPIYN